MEDQTNSLSTAVRGECATIFLAIELSRTSWLVAVRRPLSDKVSLYKLAGGDSMGLFALIARLRGESERALGGPVEVASCYEAGYDGFWLHRSLAALGVASQVMDPASLLVDRRARRAKTDRIDARRLLRALIAWWRGEVDVCSMVRVPSPDQEDAKRLHRERARLITERTAHVNRIKGLLATQGITGVAVRRHGFAARLDGLVTGDGRPLAAGLKGEVLRELERLELVMRQTAALEARRDQVLKPPAEAGSLAGQIQQLVRLNGLGVQSATLLVHEVFYRGFRNRRELAGYVGLCGCPFKSGRLNREQGISKAGNPRARSAMIELAWLWRRHQPGSALSRWFEARVNGAEGRHKRVMIVALARKLLVALWRYLETGLIPEGARLAP
jgi:transposase